MHGPNCKGVAKLHKKLPSERPATFASLAKPRSPVDPPLASTAFKPPNDELADGSPKPEAFEPGTKDWYLAKLKELEEYYQRRLIDARREIAREWTEFIVLGTESNKREAILTNALCIAYYYNPLLFGDNPTLASVGEKFGIPGKTIMEGERRLEKFFELRHIARKKHKEVALVANEAGGFDVDEIEEPVIPDNSCNDFVPEIDDDPKANGLGVSPEAAANNFDE
jgi:hypothetical protein